MSKIKTGVWGSTGNNGAVVGRLKIEDTSIMFMNCHLMSGKNKGKHRLDEINYIFDNAFKDEGLNKVSFINFEHFRNTLSRIMIRCSFLGT